jgi:acetyl esterase/lipase
MLGVIFLVISVYGALYTLNAYLPVRRGRVGFVWGFISSWITIEAAFFHIVWQLALAGVFIWLGALDTWPGVAGLVVCLVSWTGLLVLYLQGRRAAGVVNETLGPLGAGVSVRRARRRDYQVTKGVVFGRAGGRRLRLDVFAPTSELRPGEQRPAIVQIHGGGWVLGFKERQAVPLMRHLAANGWVVFNIDYRLSPAATWPDHLIDCKRAVAWVREHAAEFGVDPSFVAATGGSAGGHLTAMLALTAGDPRYQPGFEDADTSVQAAVPFYGVYDWTNRDGQFGPEFLGDILEPMVAKAFLDEDPELFAEASPLLIAEAAERAGKDADAPPMLIIHGDRDTLAPISDARSFAGVLERTSSEPVIYLELPGTQHAFDSFRSPRTDSVVVAVHRFLGALWSAHRDTTATIRSVD